MKLKELSPEEALQMADYVQPHWTAAALQKSIQQCKARSLIIFIETYIVSEAISRYDRLVEAVEHRSNLNRRRNWYELRIMSDIARAYAQKTHTHSRQ